MRSVMAGARGSAGGRDRLLPLTEDAHHADLTSYADPCRRRLVLRDGGRLGRARRARGSPDTPKPVVVRTDDAPQGAAAPAASREGLRIGLSDSGTKLVLPWFVTELTDAVNQGKSAGDTARRWRKASEELAAGTGLAPPSSGRPPVSRGR